MRRKYGSPPIKEAVCEFRLAEDTPWDATVAGLIYEHVKDTYPDRESVVQQELHSELTEEGSRQRLQVDQGVRLLGPEKRSVILIYPRRIAVSRLRPYQSWEQFRPEIGSVFEVIGDLVKVEALERIGLRYINRIEIAGDRVDMDEYFEFKLALGDRLPQGMGNFFAGAEFAFNDGRDHCRIKLTPTPADSPEALAVLLDLDYYLAKPRAVPPSEALAWADQAHDELGVLFEGCITDKLRDLFGEEG